MKLTEKHLTLLATVLRNDGDPLSDRLGKAPEAEIAAMVDKFPSLRDFAVERIAAWIADLSALKAALAPIQAPPAVTSKRPVDVGPGEQPDEVDRENHERIVTYLTRHGESAPGSIQEALKLKGAAWARALTGTPAVIAKGKGRGRLYQIAAK